MCPGHIIFVFSVLLCSKAGCPVFVINIFERLNNIGSFQKYPTFFLVGTQWHKYSLDLCFVFRSIFAF
jgi:hypothetical protein